MVPKDAVILEPETLPQTLTPRTVWAASLSRGDAVDAVFVLRRCEVRHGRTPRAAEGGPAATGMAFLAVELQDKTGTVQARLPHLPERWEQLRDAPFVRALGACRKAEPHEAREGESELMVELASLEPVAHADPRELYEHTPADPDALLAELRRTFECEVEDAWVRRMLLAFLDDAPFVEKLKTAPAASSFHHAYVGGLLEHVASLTRLALKVCEVYPRLDRSLMIAGVFLHDVGKVDELSWERGLQYTDRGQILGHIAIGVLMLEDKIRAIPGFPSRLRDLLHHLILSHHGTKEFGSPVLPVTPEAIAVHHLDNVDGKLWSAWRAQDDPRGEPAWSPFNRHLGRKIYRGD